MNYEREKYHKVENMKLYPLSKESALFLFLFNSYILSDKNKTEQQRKTFKSTVDALKDEKKMKYLLLLWSL